jgi:histidinol dehydrogenase
MIPLYKYPEPSAWPAILERPAARPGLEDTVAGILRQVKLLGDTALLRLNRDIDNFDDAALEIPRQALEAAAAGIPEALRASINLAAANIKAFHQAQRPAEINLETSAGVVCSQRFLPLDTVGIYIPGGTAPLLSTVLMLAIPAQVAGCRQLIACTPPRPDAALLYTLSLFNARVFQVGGAQAIAAMAYGTESIPRVDKIFGPGNAWVTAAKTMVAAQGVPIDLPAGPSEVLVIADDSAIPAFVAADLLSQAEHGADSQVILLTTSSSMADAVLRELETQLRSLPRRQMAASSLAAGALILVKSLQEAMDVSNLYAPEHLILAVENPSEWADRVANAGSVFLGHFTPESAGDYASGTNHTLPTGGFARNWSGVGLQSFMKSITFQEISPQGLMQIGPAIEVMARAEQLEAHARAVSLRLKAISSNKEKSNENN